MCRADAEFDYLNFTTRVATTPAGNALKQNFAADAHVIALFDLPPPRFSQSISRGFWGVRFTQKICYILRVFVGEPRYDLVVREIDICLIDYDPHDFLESSLVQ